MTCENIKCPYYKKPDKRAYFEKMMGVTNKKGGCNFNYCKLKGSKKK